MPDIVIVNMLAPSTKCYTFSICDVKYYLHNHIMDLHVMQVL